ncbi:HAD-like protein [Coprinopsis marcescibilis]|uniref:HAD-like protein n=1 Tax=Coprinopsis marcescibilis TaxID=230819 RepID=A0A5C3KXT6_COPMA|nr:HAD-like protein [Coprinopsis marcescibilis]
MTWAMKAGCMGKPQHIAAAHLLSFFPDIELDAKSYLEERDRLQDELWPTVSLLPGVRKLVHHLKKHNVPMAIATGTRRSQYFMKTGHLPEVFSLFDGQVVCADDTQYNMRGKPNPDIFLAAARELLKKDVGQPETVPTASQIQERAKGLVIEDALPGMQAGKRAGMKVLWVPDPNLLEVDYNGEEVADQSLITLEDFKPEEWGLPPYDDNS